MAELTRKYKEELKAYECGASSIKFKENKIKENSRRYFRSALSDKKDNIIDEKSKMFLRQLQNRVDDFNHPMFEENKIKGNSQRYFRSALSDKKDNIINEKSKMFWRQLQNRVNNKM